jgi:hypothetical protein
MGILGRRVEAETLLAGGCGTLFDRPASVDRSSVLVVMATKSDERS